LAIVKHLQKLVVQKEQQKKRTHSIRILTVFPQERWNIDLFAQLLEVRRMVGLLYCPCILSHLFPLVNRKNAENRELRNFFALFSDLRKSR